MLLNLCNLNTMQADGLHDDLWTCFSLSEFIVVSSNNHVFLITQFYQAGKRMASMCFLQSEHSLIATNARVFDRSECVEENSNYQF